ncbi:GNAT family N-acetyltransferase [Spirosoma luteolum]
MQTESSIVIGPATEADVPELNQLVNSAYRGDTSRRGWTTEADLLDGIRTDEAGLLAMLRQPHTRILTARQNGTLVGCVYLEQKADELYLGMLSVAPDRQAGGLGRQLLTAGEAYGRAVGCRRVTMTVISVRRELIAWYERRGYAPTGESQPFPADERFGIQRQPLRFIVMAKALD